MKIVFVCPKCNNILDSKEKSFSCKQCNKNFLKNHNFYDFSDKETFSENKMNSKMRKLLESINQFSYEKGIKEFVKEFPDEKTYLLNTKFDQSVDTVFHCFNINYKTCLIIGDHYGNHSEVLAEIFETVYSINSSNQSIEFQLRRFKEKDISNVICIKTNPEDLPFIENTFDMILFKNHDVYKELNKYESNIVKSEYLQKVKKILNDGGCLCLSLQNKSGVNIFLDNKELSEFSKIKKYSYKDYLQIFKNLDFKLKTYWGLPSEKKPYFSAKMDDEIVLRWYFQNFSTFVKDTKIKTKQKILFFILKNIPGLIRKFLIQNFAPFFIFYCYKNHISESIEDKVLLETKFEHCLLISRRIKVIFILFDRYKKPKFIVHLKRYGKEFSKKLSIYDRVFPEMGNPKEQFWLEKWKDGRTLNPLKKEEVIAAINWLVNFQKNTSQEIFKREDFSDEIQIIQNEIQNDSSLNKIQYKKWVNDYELMLKNNKIRKSAIHGDFWYANMLYDSKRKIVNLVDWENYRKNGNPFHDLTTFIMRCMMMSDSNQIDTFKLNLTINKKFKNLLKEIQKIVDVHYNFSIDFDILLRYLILRNAVKVVDKQGIAYYNYLEMLKILEKNGFYQNDIKDKKNWSDK